MKELEYSGQGIPKGRRFCTCCGQVKKETAFAGDSTHCKDCCEKMLKTQPHWYGGLILLVLVVFFGLAIWVGVQTVPVVRSIRSADQLAQNRALYDAVEAYDDVFSAVNERNQAIFHDKETDKQFISAGLRTWEKYYSIYTKAYSGYDAAGDSREKLNYRQMQKSDSLIALQHGKDAYDTIDSNMQTIKEKYNIVDPEKMPFEQVMQDIDAITWSGDQRYLDGYKAYFKAQTIIYRYSDGSHDKEIFAALDEAEKLIPEDYQIFNTLRATVALNRENYDQLIQAANHILEKNQNYIQCYDWLIRSYEAKGDTKAVAGTLEDMQKKCPDSPLAGKVMVMNALRQGDLKKAEELCNRQDEKSSAAADAAFNTILSRDGLPRKAEKIFLEYIDFSMAEAAVMLLEGDTDSAFNIAYNYVFNYAYYYDYIIGGGALNQRIVNLTTLCASLFKGDQAKEAKDALDQVGPCDELTQKVIDGEISLQEALVEGKVDLL